MIILWKAVFDSLLPTLAKGAGGKVATSLFDRALEQHRKHEEALRLVVGKLDALARAPHESGMLWLEAARAKSCSDADRRERLARAQVELMRALPLASGYQRSTIQMQLAMSFGLLGLAEDTTTWLQRARHNSDAWLISELHGCALMRRSLKWYARLHPSGRVAWRACQQRERAFADAAGEFTRHRTLIGEIDKMLGGADVKPAWEQTFTCTVTSRPFSETPMLMHDHLWTFARDQISVGEVRHHAEVYAGHGSVAEFQPCTREEAYQVTHRWLTLDTRDAERKRA